MARQKPVTTSVETASTRYRSPVASTARVPVDPEPWKKLNEDIRKVVNAPEFRKGLEEQGMSAVANTLPEADAFVAREKQRWDQVITAGKISAN